MFLMRMSKHLYIYNLKICLFKRGFPGGRVIKNPPANTGGSRFEGSVLGSGQSPGEGNGNLLRYSCLENAMDRGAWRATVHGVPESQT